MGDYAPVDLTADDQVTFELNGRTVTAPAGTMLVDACFAHGVEVPIFCYEPRLGPPIGACRMCLVEVEGMRGLQTACSTPVQQDMVVRTDSALAKDAQDGVLELLLANHPLDCPVCDKGGECPLQDRTYRFGPGRTRFIERKRHFPKPLELSTRIALDRERCIHCFRCVRFSQDVAQDGQLTMQERGAAQEITTFTGDPYEGRFTGNVIDLCPVGALTSIPYRFVARPWDIQNTPTVCGVCPVGCNTELSLREGRVMRVTGRADANYAHEEGWLCDTGRWGYDAVDAPERLVAPVVRDATGERLTDIEDGVLAASLVLRGAGAAGPQGRPVGILLGPSATVEEGAIALDLAGGGALDGARVGRLGIPGEAVAGLRALPGAQLADLDLADVLVIVGGDPGAQQPVAELRIRKARRFGAAVVTVGSRPHALEALDEAIRTVPGALAEAVTAVTARIAEAARPVVLWDEADLAVEPEAAAALAAAVAGNPAALQLELGQDVNGAGLRALGIPAAGILEALVAGELGALLTVHADPLEGPGGGVWAAALAEADVPVVAIATHAGRLTAEADVVLPALTHWEAEGTLVSMNGRAQRVRTGGRGPGEAAAGWELLVALAHRLGRPPAYRTAASAFRHASARHPGLGGITYDDMGDTGVPLPPPAGAVPGEGAPRPAAGDGLPLVVTRHVHGGPAAARSAALAATRWVGSLQMGAETASRLGFATGDRVRLVSPHGAATLPVQVEEGWPEEVAFAPLGAAGFPVEGLLPPDRGAVRVVLERVPAGVAA